MRIWQGSLALISSALLMGCGGDGDSPSSGEPYGYTDIACPVEASTSDYTEGFREVIKNSHRFVEVYRASMPDSQADVPEVDFDEKMVVAIHLGEKPRSGYQAKVIGVTRKQDAISVTYEAVSPSCPSETVLTYPSCFVSMDKSDMPVEFEVVEVSRCP